MDPSVGDSTYLDAVIAQVEAQINADLNDDFEPAPGDADVTLEVTADGGYTLYLPRRCRSITTLKTRAADGTLTTEAATSYRLHSSLNAAGTEMVDGSHLDWVDVLTALSTVTWPYGWQTVQIVGKFGWAVCPTDIKRLTALMVYDYVKPQNSNLRKTERLQTDQATYTFVPESEVDLGIPEADRIRRAYRRDGLMVG